MKVNFVLLMGLVTLTLGQKDLGVKGQKEIDVTRIESVESTDWSPKSFEVNDDTETSANFHKRYYYPHYYPKYYYRQPATRYNRPMPQYNTNQYYSQPSTHRPTIQQLPSTGRQPYQHQTTTTTTTPTPPPSKNNNKKFSIQPSDDNENISSLIVFRYLFFQ